MKKRLFAALLIILAIVAICGGAFAESASYADLTKTDLPRLIDNAGLLTSEEEQELSAKLWQFTKDNNFDLVFLTTNTTDGKSITAYADDYYDYNGYGYGSTCDGVIFVIDMGSRNYWTSTTGFGITAFTDYGIKQLGDSIKGKLSSGDYYGAFEKYIETAEQYVSAARAGTPYDVGNTKPSDGSRDWQVYFKRVLIAAIASLVIAIVAVLVMRSGMNTATKKHAAEEYVNPGSFDVNQHSDIFLYSNVTRVRRQQESSGGGGGGSSTHIGSSGTSHGGGGGSF